MCANVNILSGRRSISRSGLHSNMVNFQLFLYMLSESFMKTKFQKKKSNLERHREFIAMFCHNCPRFSWELSFDTIHFHQLISLLLTQFLNNAWMCFAFSPLIILTGKPDRGVTVWKTKLCCCQTQRYHHYHIDLAAVWWKSQTAGRKSQRLQWEFLMMWQIFDCVQWLEATILMSRSHPTRHRVRPVCI